jgi:excinuclease ABC subunit B
MQFAIDETNRRRAKQVEYNLEHGITPKSVVRKITDVMEGARADAEAERAGKRTRGSGARRVAEPTLDYATLSPEKLAAEMKKLEAKMYKHAQNLEFEEAAQARDELHRLREKGLIG